MAIIDNQNELLSIEEASSWASTFLQRTVTKSNISYLIQYGRIRKIGENATAKIAKEDLIKYYQYQRPSREMTWKKTLGDDLNWSLSFEQYRESETTKHVHRLHPYKGKFIPQLVKYFLDDHIDNFKKEIYFKKGDIILDPFCGSGTTLVQANELGMHSIGIDISAFNSLISNIKIRKYDLEELDKPIKQLTNDLREGLRNAHAFEFESALLVELDEFNSKHFPSPEFKYRVRQKQVDERKYGIEREGEFLRNYVELIQKYGIKLRQQNGTSFLGKWYLHTVRHEIDFIARQVRQIKNPDIKQVISVILSRTIRSCRATTHSDLATLKEPQTTTYYCKKHGKICKPLFSILSWWKRYSIDTISRFKQFEKLRTNNLSYRRLERNRYPKRTGEP